MTIHRHQHDVFDISPPIYLNSTPLFDDCRGLFTVCVMRSTSPKSFGQSVACVGFGADRSMSGGEVPLPSSDPSNIRSSMDRERCVLRLAAITRPQEPPLFTREGSHPRTLPALTDIYDITALYLYHDGDILYTGTTRGMRQSLLATKRSVVPSTTTTGYDAASLTPAVVVLTLEATSIWSGF